MRNRIGKKGHRCDFRQKLSLKLRIHTKDFLFTPEIKAMTFFDLPFALPANFPLNLVDECTDYLCFVVFSLERF